MDFRLEHARPILQRRPFRRLRPLRRQIHEQAVGAGHAGQLLATWVAHDLFHPGQIVRVMARQYADAVGPWRAYLSLLRPQDASA